MKGGVGSTHKRSSVREWCYGVTATQVRILPTERKEIKLRDMKGISRCCCETDGYVNPWCRMLNGCGCDSNILHLWYKLSVLQEEVAKRTSYLGKLRRTKGSVHLLDLIAMTKDESNMFYPFAKSAMSDVFDALDLYIPEHRKSFLWREGSATKVFAAYPVIDTYVAYVTEVGYEGNDIEIAFDLTCDEIDTSVYDIELLVKLRYEVEYGVKDTSSVLREERSLYHRFKVLSPYTDGGYHLSDSISVELSGESEYTTAEEISRLSIFVGEDISSDIIKIEISKKLPDEYKKDDYVEIGDSLYIATRDGDTNDLSGLELQENDFRESIHYIISYPADKNVSYIEPLDTAVFEALVSRIIYKWLEYSYPSESSRYLAEYDECLSNIRRRLGVFKESVVHRIPRYY